MARRIFKYPFGGSTFTLNMPSGAEIVKVDVQEVSYCLWAIVQDDAPLEAREFFVFGTGHALPPRGQVTYIGTVQDPPFVWHLFERISQ